MKESMSKPGRWLCDIKKFYVSLILSAGVHKIKFLTTRTMLGGGTCIKERISKVMVISRFWSLKVASSSDEVLGFILGLWGLVRASCYNRAASVGARDFDWFTTWDDRTVWSHSSKRSRWRQWSYGNRNASRRSRCRRIDFNDNSALPRSGLHRRTHGVESVRSQMLSDLFYPTTRRSSIAISLRIGLAISKWMLPRVLLQERIC